MKNPLKKLSWNSPVILTFAAVCLAMLLINEMTKGWLNSTLLVCYGHGSLLNPLTYPRLFLHCIGHVNFAHFTNNMLMLLLVGPVVEEKYGSWNTIVMIVITAFGTGVLNTLFFDTGIIGASGIVFLMIILSAFTNMQKGRIPITLIIVCAIYLGQEIYDGLTANDNISHFGHLIGGAFGLGFGIYYHKKKFERTI